MNNVQKWYQSPTLWFALITIALLIFGGIVQMSVIAIPHWLAIVLGGMVAVFIGFQKLKNAQDPNALMLSDAPAKILTTVGAVIVLLYGYLATQKILFPVESFGAIIGVIAVFIGSDRMKNMIILKNQLPINTIPPVIPPTSGTPNA